ncbi:hypothetical protein D3C75_1095300 [compost metagenome]
MIGCRQVQANPSRLQREDEHIGLISLRLAASRRGFPLWRGRGLELLYHAVTGAFGRAAVQIQHRFLQLLGQHGLQHLAHADILGEDQAALILLAQLTHHGEQPLQLR